ncbi:hypothetical protein HDF16_006098 [Granulicella aggregans]|uniref:Uncharacterized protein n=1 Tax=Granulicella aggregans TaxID=474949 RepID=A0A7W7ZKB5_9BACT|nr:hypothetical protein [Granulicella aggregans]
MIRPSLAAGERLRDRQHRDSLCPIKNAYTCRFSVPSFVRNRLPKGGNECGRISPLSLAPL